MTYRTGHHSTSDDSSRYRGAAEIQHWKLQRDPVARFRRWLQGQGWWDDRQEEELRKSARAEVGAQERVGQARSQAGICLNGGRSDGLRASNQ
jgi:TPP-dependent pyruvate/acetoin dehydrogenase alpha subunit